jgi:hypothetical protein
VIEIKARLIYLAVMTALSAQALLAAFGGISLGYFDGDH